MTDKKNEQLATHNSLRRNSRTEQRTEKKKNREQARHIFISLFFQKQ